MQEVLDTCDFVACLSIQTTQAVDRAGNAKELLTRIENAGFGGGTAMEGLDEGNKVKKVAKKIFGKKKK